MLRCERLTLFFLCVCVCVCFCLFFLWGGELKYIHVFLTGRSSRFQGLVDDMHNDIGGCWRLIRF